MRIKKKKKENGTTAFNCLFKLMIHMDACIVQNDYGVGHRPRVKMRQHFFYKRVMKNFPSKSPCSVFPCKKPLGVEGGQCGNTLPA